MKKISKTYILLVITILCANTLWGATYYIDPCNGNDNNNGEVDTPWKSTKNIFSYYKSEYRPSTWVNLKPGDSIYLKKGIYSKSFHPGAWQKGPSGGGSFIAYFRGKKGDKNNPYQLKAFPGHKPIFDPQGKGFGLSIFQSGSWIVEGIEVRNAYGRGISLNESQNIKIHKVQIHDTDG